MWKTMNSSYKNTIEILDWKPDGFNLVFLPSNIESSADGHTWSLIIILFDVWLDVFDFFVELGCHLYWNIIGDCCGWDIRCFYEVID